MPNEELLNYYELANDYYENLTYWCKSWGQSDLFLSSYKKGDNDILQLKVFLNPSLNDVVFGLRQDNRTEKAARLENAIANTHKAVDDYDNGKIIGVDLVSVVLRITGELEALCRPAAPQQPAGKGQKEIFEAKPGVAGFTVDIKEIAKRILMRVCSRRKD